MRVYCNSATKQPNHTHHTATTWFRKTKSQTSRNYASKNNNNTVLLVVLFDISVVNNFNKEMFESEDNAWKSKTKFKQEVFQRPFLKSNLFSSPLSGCWCASNWMHGLAKTNDQFKVCPCVAIVLSLKKFLCQRTKPLWCLKEATQKPWKSHYPFSKYLVDCCAFF